MWKDIVFHNQTYSCRETTSDPSSVINRDRHGCRADKTRARLYHPSSRDKPVSCATLDTRWSGASSSW